MESNSKLVYLKYGQKSFGDKFFCLISYRSLDFFNYKISFKRSIIFSHNWYSYEFLNQPRNLLS